MSTKTKTVMGEGNALRGIGEPIVDKNGKIRDVFERENAASVVLALFNVALKLAENEENYATDKLQDAQNAAFDAAAKYGWDWEADERFSDWCLKATDVEIITEGRQRFKEATDAADPAPHIGAEQLADALEDMLDLHTAGMNPKVEDAAGLLAEYRTQQRQTPDLDEEYAMEDETEHEVGQ